MPSKTETAPKNRTGFLPGTEPPRIPELTKKVIAWEKVKNSRVALSRKEKVAIDEVMSMMKKNNLTAYYFDDDSIIEIVPTKEKLKIRHIEDDNGVDDTE